MDAAVVENLLQDEVPHSREFFLHFVLELYVLISFFLIVLMSSSVCMLGLAEC